MTYTKGSPYEFLGDIIELEYHPVKEEEPGSINMVVCSEDEAEMFSLYSLHMVSFDDKNASKIHVWLADGTKEEIIALHDFTKIILNLP